MNLVWFLTIIAVGISLLGEFGRFPFAASNAVSLLDLCCAIILGSHLIWQIGINQQLKLFKGWTWLLGFLVMALLSLVFADNWQGLFYLLRFSIYASLSWVGYQLIRSKQIKLINLQNLLIIGSLSFGAIGLLQLIFLPDFNMLINFGYDPHQFRLSSSLLDPNFVGTILNFGLFLSLVVWFNCRERRYIYSAVFLFSCLVLTFSRSAYLMAMVMSLPFWFKLNRRTLISLILVGLVIFAIPRVNQRILGGWQIDASASQRFSSWQNGLTAFRQFPLLGVGFNNWRDYSLKQNLQQVYSSDGGHAGNGIDSSLVFILATSGIFGFISYFGWWGSLAYYFSHLSERRIYLGLVVGLMINSQFINSLFFPTVMLYYFLLFGALSYEEGV